ncbi:sigma 54-interacting transcriptional regulator, partial [Vibrio parahaemolyticus]
MQAKLLRVLQEREITRVGGNVLVPIDVRIIVATHRDLLTEVTNKTFREDLYYRLLGLPIALPPLRDRGNDILILAKYFIQSF